MRVTDELTFPELSARNLQGLEITVPDVLMVHATS